MLLHSLRSFCFVGSISGLSLSLDLLSLLYLRNVFTLLEGIFEVVLLELFSRFLRGARHGGEETSRSIGTKGL